MRFGPVPLADAKGAILAHAAAVPSGRLPKGTLLGEGEIDALAEAGILEPVVARLGQDDIGEDAAATLIASALSPDHLTITGAATGRINLHAAVDGLFVASRTLVDRFNRIDPAITLACLSDHVAVRAGDMVATLKIIPLAVPRDKVEQAAALFGGAPAFSVKPFRARDVALVATLLPALKPQVMDKTRRVLEDRLRRSSSRLLRELRVAHEMSAVARAMREAVNGLSPRPGTAPGLVIVFGASAVTDGDDVIPAAIRAAGGRVHHVGMPVDPGNLLVVGSIDGVDVIGAPGCARSPRENGFDWVLDRIVAGETVGAYEITGMGVGGLLAEIATRPKPRDLRDPNPAGPAAPPVVKPVVLAAGQASRMGASGRHKLLAEFDGVPMVRRTVQSAIDAALGTVTVVTGHRASEIRDALAGLEVAYAHNEDFASGMASSLIAGLDAAEPADGILVLLSDMPGIDVTAIARLHAAFVAEGGAVVVRAVSEGKRGNPVILPRSLFPALRRLQGDVGARHVIETGGVRVVDVEIGPAAHLDLDTPDAILAAGGVLKG